MSKGQLVAVTGASGFVGRHVVRELVSRGWKVRALVRSPERAVDAIADGSATRLREMGVELVIGDVCEARAAGACVSGAAACVHLVGIIREKRGEHPGDPVQTFERLHTQATRTMVEACRAAGVQRYVQMSALGVGPEGKSAYQKTKWEAEQIVRRSGLDWTIFRPSLIHGAGSEFIEMMSDLVSGEQAPWFFIPYFVRQEFDPRLPMNIAPTRMVPAKVQPVAVQDVAMAFAKALETPGAVGEVYTLAGPETLDWQQLTIALRDTLPTGNKRLGTFYVPGPHAAVIAKVAKAVGVDALLPFDEGQALMATQDNTAESTKAEIELGFRPVGFNAALRGYAASV